MQTVAIFYGGQTDVTDGVCFGKGLLESMDYMC